MKELIELATACPRCNGSGLEQSDNNECGVCFGYGDLGLAAASYIERASRGNMEHSHPLMQAAGKILINYVGSLKQYIQQHHNGNVTAYAKKYGTSRQQMEKWLKLDCRVIDGIIYRPVAKHKDRSPTT